MNIFSTMAVKLPVFFLILVSVCDGLHADMEAFVVGGDFTPINNYPHSVFLGISCIINRGTTNWICGSSILNQYFTLTAGHCVEDCLSSSTITIVVGDENRDRGYKSSGLSFKIHENYDTFSMKCDIALVKVRTPFKLNQNVKRVAIYPTTDFKEPAFVAGWGLVDEIKHIGTKSLKHVKQALWTRTDCMKVLGYIPVGCICAGVRKGTYFASEGDSGSALVVRGYVQVGIVSYKIPSISTSLSVYTDVSYYYDWITANTRQMHCNVRKRCK